MPRSRPERFAHSALAAIMVLAAIVLTAFADEALPTGYLLRPLAVAAAVGALIGAACVPFGRRGPAIAAAISLIVAVPSPPIVLTAVVVGAGLVYLERPGRPAVGLARPTFILTAVFLGAALVRSVPVMETAAAGRAEVPSGPPIYVVLLDGYPRLDSLASIGVDNTSFVRALEQRGFDHYPDAHSLHTDTVKSLQAMLTTDVVANEPASIDEVREIRRRLAVPEGFLAIDPPFGYPTLGPGRHHDPGGVNEFEVALVGRSVVGLVAVDWAWSTLLDSLRDRLTATLGFLAKTDERRVFAHLMVPHPPFLYGPDGSTNVPRWCWPQCGLFTTTIENLAIDRSDWAEGMANHLEQVNALLLQTIDDVLARHPGAAIVLFSDHGGRYSEADQDEMHRSFLAARTPGHPLLFEAAPRPDTIIRTLVAAYP